MSLISFRNRHSPALNDVRRIDTWTGFDGDSLALLPRYFYNGTSGCMEFEIHIPLLRPSREKAYLPTMSLHQHFLQTDHAGTTHIVIRPIVASWEKCRKPKGAVLNLVDNEFLGGFGQS